MMNDGFQPWFSDRKRFELRSLQSREMAASEEGLAAINTLVNARQKYLFGPAYIYCKIVYTGSFDLKLLGFKAFLYFMTAHQWHHSYIFDTNTLVPL